MIERSLEAHLRYLDHESKLAAYRQAVQGRALALEVTEESRSSADHADVIVRWSRQLDGARVRDIRLSPGTGPDTGYTFTVDPLMDLVPFPAADRTNDPCQWGRLLDQPNLLGLLVASWLSPASIHLVGEGRACFSGHRERCRWTAEVRRLEHEGITVRPDAPATPRPSMPLRPIDRVLLSVNPNAESLRGGHFVSFDRQLRDQALAKGSAFLMAGHRRLERGEGYEPWMLPWFDRRTSGSHVSDPTNVSSFIEQTTEQLETILAAITQHFDRPTVFWYLGSAEYVPVVERLSREFPDTNWHLHLFWDFLVDRTNPAAVRRFRELVARAESLSRVQLTLGTQPLLEEFEHVLVDSPFRLLPDGPSVSIPDDEARHRILSPARERGDGPFRILCPGGHAVGKNWEVGASVLVALAERHGEHFECVLRFVEAQATRSEKKIARGLVDVSNLDLVEGLLDEHVLIEMLDTSDVVFLPYGTELFSQRSSGLLTEAVISGARIVCFEGTYLAWIVEKFGLGTSLSELSPVDDCVEAIVDEATRARSGDPAEQGARLEYLAENSWERIHDIVMGGTR